VTGARSQFGTIRSTGAAGLRPPSPLVRLHGWRKREVRAGFTLVELVIVFAIIAILVALAVPSLSGLTRVSSEGAIRTTMRSLFASARMRAAATQRYVGIRFQQDAEGRQYAVMLQQVEPSEYFPNGCPAYHMQCTFLTLTAVGEEPLQLPRGVELAQGDVGLAAAPEAEFEPDPVRKVIPATTFTVVFSPSGQIVRRQVHVTQRPDRWFRASSGNFTVRTWHDPVFNLAKRGKFLPDVIDESPPVPKPLPPDDPDDLELDTDPDPQTGDGPNTGKRNTPDTALYEMSQNSVWVYEHQKRLDAGATPFAGYIQQQGTLIPLNVYTGAPVNTRQ